MIDSIEHTQLQLLAPVSLATFFTDYWEAQPLHVSRGDSAYFKALLSIRDIEEALSCRPLYFPDVQLTQSGQSISHANYADSDNLILPLRLSEFHADGATIVLSRAQHVFSKLADLCRAVSAAFLARCQTNVYVSAPGKQGFNAHYDTHDVFILQVSGSKTFHFYPSSTRLPLTEETFDPDRVKSVAIDESVTLEAGDTLYIPRGVVHDAIADDSTQSLHITLGIYPLLVKDLLQDMIQIAAEGNADFRCSALDKSLGIADMKKLMDQSMRQQNLDTAINRFKDELALGLAQDNRGLLRQSEQPGDVEDARSVSLRREMILSHEQNAERVTIRMFGQIVAYENPFRAAVALLLQTGELCGSDVSYLSSEQRRSLFARLHRDNLIVLA